ncbi:MAG: hypothetical protein NC548_22975 [Lachnospiraceae bacterium]|nr:hypothetical protein [Lachnospiraceae bacterium]
MKTQKELSALLTKYHAAKVAEKKASTLKNEIIVEAEERGVEMLEAGGFIVTVKQVTSPSFDLKRFKEDYPELAERYITSSTHPRVNIK